MKTIFDEQTTNELISRIKGITEHSKAQWGKMSPYQMMRHCTLSEEMFLGKKQYKRLFIGRLFGKMALNGIIKNSNPVKKNMPTHPVMKVTGTGDMEAEKTKWIALLKEYKHYSTQHFLHPFFGSMTMEQVGHFAYKHTDHHIRQFGN